LAGIRSIAWFISTCMSAHLPRLLQHFGLTLQTATAIRDRVVQAYQDIMKMPI